MKPMSPWSPFNSTSFDDNKLVDVPSRSLRSYLISSDVHDDDEKTRCASANLKKAQMLAEVANTTLKCANTGDLAERAARQASELDAQTTPKKPLHGVPVSIKESFAVTGQRSPLGLRELNEPTAPVALEDAAIFTLLRAAGAVPFARTSVPPLLNSTETNNPITGRCLNPHCHALTPGGSSGGEACLVASGASPFGVGTDFGGSVRVPAHFCGVSAIMVDTERRWRKWRRGCGGVHGALEMIDRAEPYTSLGFFAHTAVDLRLGVKALMEAATALDDDDDSGSSGMQWTPADIKRVGVVLPFDYDGSPREFDGVEVAPPCREAMQAAVASLEKAGIEVTSYKPPPGLVAATIQVSAGVGELAPGKRRTPRWAKKLAAWAAAWFTRRGAELLRASSECQEPQDGGWVAHEHIAALREQMAQSWREQGIDALLAPAFPIPAYAHGRSEEAFLGLGVTGVWNALGAVAGVARSGVRVSARSCRWFPRESRDLLVARLVKLYHETLGLLRETGCELPVGVQVVGGSEEAVLAVMELVEANQGG